MRPGTDRQALPHRDGKEPTFRLEMEKVFAVEVWTEMFEARESAGYSWGRWV